jgi:hypothetical protein
MTNMKQLIRIFKSLMMKQVFAKLVSLLLILLIAVTMLAGCAFQADIIQKRYWDLNETIRHTTQEQLLLNLVRLRYDEQPYFLQLASITTNFSAGGTIGSTATLPEEGSNIFGLSTGLSYSESPSVTWAVPDGRELLGRLYAPVGADQLAVLSQSGFNLIDVFRIGSRRINVLRNKEFEITSGEFVPDSYDEFLEALILLEELRREDLVDFSFALMSNYGGASFPIAKLDVRAIPDAYPNKLFFLERSSDPGTIVPRSFSNPLFLRFSLESDRDPRGRRVRDLLKLDPEAYSFPITNTKDVSPELLRTESGELSLVYDSSVALRHIMLNNRSVIEIMRFAAAAIDVPPEDLAAGVVRERSLQDKDYLEVLTSRSEPSKAWLKVEYRGNWYYIASNDLASRTSFSLLNALFASVVGEIPGAKPVLTLPVN